MIRVESYFPPVIVKIASDPESRYISYHGNLIKVPLETTHNDIDWVKIKFEDEKIYYETYIKALRGSGMYRVTLGKKWKCECSSFKTKKKCNHIPIAMQEYEKK